MELQDLINSLSLIDDPHGDKNKHYLLPLLITFRASISKHDSWYTRTVPRFMCRAYASSASSFRVLS